MKITKPKDRKENNDKWNEKLFINRAIQEDYVLLLGSEGLLSCNNENFSSVQGNSNVFLLERTIDEINKYHNIDSDRYNSFTELSYFIKGVDEYLLDALAGIEPESCDVSEEVTALLRLKCFKVVITTTVDPFIECVMREIYGDELVVMDIFSNDKKDFKEEIQYKTKPILYYLFGKADPNNRNKRFAITENEQMEVIAERWLGALAPKEFLKLLRSKYKLSIGCKFDDWFFRFLWYMLIGNVQELNKGEIAISFSTSESDTSLKKYMEKHRVHVEPNMKSFLTKITDLLKEHNDEIEVLNKRRQYGIFISYASENANIALTMFRKLTEAKFDVWLDNSRLKTGDSYEKDIEKAIEQCSMFIPIISESVKCEKERYFKKEWNIVISCNNLGGKQRKIWPVLYGVEINEIKDLLPKEFDKTIFDLLKNDISQLINNITEEYNK